MMNDGGMWFGGGFGWIFWITIAAVLIWIIKIATRSSDNHDSTDNSALEILKKRYARGEIDEQEFQRRRKELEK